MLSILIALPFLLSAISKSIDSGFFLRQLARSTKFPQTILPVFALCVLGINWLLVAGFLTKNCSFVIIPIAVFYLLCATLVTIIQWIKTQKPSCGCYGPGIVVHPLLSISINILCLFGISLLEQNDCTVNHLQIDGVTVLAGLILARFSAFRPLIDLSPTAIDKIWTQTPHYNGKLHLVAFLSPNCDSCKEWLPVLITIHKKIPVHIITADSFTGMPQSVHIEKSTKKIIFQKIELFPTVLAIKDRKILQRWLLSPSQNILEEIARLN